MDVVLFEMHGEVLGYAYNLVLTSWKLFGYVGIILFAGSWLIQLWQSRRAGKPVISRWFWICRLAGSAILCSYFVFSPKQDSVGILSNAFPIFVAAYNLYLDVRYHRNQILAQSNMHLQAAPKSKNDEDEDASAGQRIARPEPVAAK